MLILKVVLLISCVILIASILLQSGNKAGLSGSFGGGAEQIFGSKKAQGYDKLFDKITKAGAIVFIVSALALVIIQ